MCMGQKVMAQTIPAIDSLKIISENGETKVVCYATFTSGSCDLVDYTISTENNVITLNLNYTVGAATYICHSEDTISIGFLSPGDYTLDANMMIGSPEIIVHHKSAEFTVGELSIDNPNTTVFNVYPNPVQNTISIETNSVVQQLEIISIFGQNVRTIGMLETTIDVSDLEEGIYLIRLTDDKGRQVSKRVLKTK